MTNIRELGVGIDALPPHDECNNNSTVVGVTEFFTGLICMCAKCGVIFEQKDGQMTRLSKTSTPSSVIEAFPISQQ